MRKLNAVKNVIITLMTTMLYAIWSTKELHELTALEMWAILIMFAILVLHLLVWTDREVIRVGRERRRKREKITRDSK